MKKEKVKTNEKEGGDHKSKFRIFYNLADLFYFRFHFPQKSKNWFHNQNLFKVVLIYGIN